jgi:CDP-ribitol ribitolphosphotransferase
VGERFIYAIYRWAIRAMFALLRQSPTRRRIAFLSRQSDEPSLDFELLESALRARLPDWEITRSCYRDSGSTVTRIKGTLRQLKLVATSRLCIVDGYTPAVSIPRLSDDTVVIQLWHALGAIKRFGWQAIGTSCGRTQAQAQGLCMHRNYTAIMAGGEGARSTFAQAFSYPENKVLALGLPRVDYLLDERLARERKDIGASVVKRYAPLASGRTNILFVPTFRRNAGKIDVARHVWDLASHLPAETSNLIVSFHPFSNHSGKVIARADSSADPASPVDPAGPASSADTAGSASSASPARLTNPVDLASQQAAFPADAQAPVFHVPHTRGIDLLEIADYVITDYSAIAFEAALLRRKVLFYVPDILDYRQSPGLSIDLEELFPLITFRDTASLAEFLRRDLERGDKGDGTILSQSPLSPYAASGFWQYCDSYLAQPTVGVTERLAAYLADLITPT